jgi:hypothetical protein
MLAHSSRDKENVELYVCIQHKLATAREHRGREREKRKSNLQRRARPTDAVHHFLDVSFLMLPPRVICVCVCVCCVYWGVVFGSRHPS